MRLDVNAYGCQCVWVSVCGGSSNMGVSACVLVRVGVSASWCQCVWVVSLSMGEY